MTGREKDTQEVKKEEERMGGKEQEEGKVRAEDGREECK